MTSPPQTTESKELERKLRRLLSGSVDAKIAPANFGRRLKRGFKMLAEAER